jgi:hypothetical protein
MTNFQGLSDDYSQRAESAERDGLPMTADLMRGFAGALSGEGVDIEAVLFQISDVVEAIEQKMIDAGIR